MSKTYGPLIRHALRRGLTSKAGFSYDRPTRRDLLRRGAAGLAAAALAPAIVGGAAGCRRGRSSRQKQSWRQDRPAHVGVIGAGFSGLACADTLVQGGAQVIVLEATSRPGGRVVTDRRFVAGDNVELGGEWFGPVHTTWLRYVKEFGLQLEEPIDPPGDDPILLGGRLLRGDAADALFAEFDELTANLIALARNIDPVRPFESPNAADLDAKSLAVFIAEQQLIQDARTYVSAAAQADNGVPPDQMSLLAFLAMVAGGGFEKYYTDAETYRLADGNDALASALARKLGDAVVHYESPVASVTRTPAGVMVTTTNGATLEFDAVVLAIPPSVWDRIQFDPPLPDGLTPQMGKNVKLLLKLNQRFWEASGLRPGLASDGLVHLTWLSTDPNAPAQGPDGPTFGLTIFSGGQRAEELRRLHAADRADRAIASLAAVYPNLGDAVVADRFVDWLAMPRARASYSFPAPGQVTAFGPTLVDGISDDGLAPLLFAGEHTSYGFIGYMEGALSSGVRVANSLLDTRAVIEA